MSCKTPEWSVNLSQTLILRLYYVQGAMHKSALPHPKMSQSEVNFSTMQGLALIQRAPGLGIVRSNRRFRSMFGVSQRSEQ